MRWGSRWAYGPVAAAGVAAAVSLPARLSFREFLTADSGANLAATLLARMGQRPNLDFGYPFGPLSLGLQQACLAAIPRGPYAMAALTVAASLLLGWGASWAIRRLKLEGAAAALMTVAAVLGAVASLWPPVYTLEAAALALDPGHLAPHLWTRLALGMAAVCVLASSYYTLNEVLDAPFDRLHPIKCARAAAAGRIHRGWAYAQFAALTMAWVALGWAVSPAVAAVLAVLWLFACAYNVRPVRTKDVPYLDVLTESVNNPLRLLIGWYIAGAVLVPPALLLLSYWMLGAYFMAMKRFAERREIPDAARAAAYRPSLGAMTESRLLVSVMFYGAAAMLFFGAFLMRYRLELILTFPLLAWVMAKYLAIGLLPHSPVQTPERLWRQPSLMIPVALCTAAMLLCLWVQIPWLHRATEPTVASQQR